MVIVQSSGKPVGGRYVIVQMDNCDDPLNLQEVIGFGKEVNTLVEVRNLPISTANTTTTTTNTTSTTTEPSTALTLGMTGIVITKALIRPLFPKY